MQDAFDTVRARKVAATAVAGNRFRGRYICPVCQTEVAYAAGNYMVPHFRHIVGTDHERCERYARGFAVNVPFAQHEGEHHDAVLAARPRLAAGGARIEFAIRFRPAFPISAVELASSRQAIRYKVDAEAREYYLPVDEANPEYLVNAHVVDGDVEPHLIEGFGPKPAVFRTAEREAIRLPPHRIVRPGTHWVVATREVQSRLHRDVSTEALVTLPGLFACAINIPHDPSWMVRENLRQVLGVEVSRHLADYGFWHPHTAVDVAPDAWEIGSHEDAEVFVRLSTELRQVDTAILVQIRRAGRLTSETTQVSKGIVDFSLCFSGEGDSPDLYRIGIGSPPQFLVEIRRASSTPGLRAARLTFTLGTRGHAHRTLNWSSHLLPQQVSSVKKTAHWIESFNLPDSVIVKAVDGLGNHIVAWDSRDTTEFNQFIRAAKYPCRMAATGYGTIVIRQHGRADGQEQRARANKAPSRCRSPRAQAAVERGLLSRYAASSMR